MNIFSSNNIQKTYRTGRLQQIKKTALSDITFKVNRNEVFGIIGLNGAGKSTILKIFMGFIKPDRGKAYINGKNVTSNDSRKHIGYLAENPSLYPHLSLTEHLRFRAQVAGLSKEETNIRIHHVLKTVDLSEKAKLPIKNFSKGMTQRAALAYAILTKPSILILDEPMSGLDPLGRQLVIDILLKYQEQGATILFCSHLLTDVERLCDRIAIIHNGQLKSIVTPDSLLEQGFSKSGNKQSPLEGYFLQTIGQTNQ